MRLYAWIKKMFSVAKPEPMISCVHGRTAFMRNQIAARLFTESLGEDGGTIICSPKACVGIVESLGVDLPDEAKWWHSGKKWELAREELAKSFPSVTLSRTPVDAELIWVDGECLANGLEPKHTVIFTGTLKEDPFCHLERMTYEASGTQCAAWKTLANQYCSSWHK